MKEIYRVTGCGVSVVSDKKNVPYWITEIVSRGGVPQVQKWADGLPL